MLRVYAHMQKKREQLSGEIEFSDSYRQLRPLSPAAVTVASLYRATQLTDAIPTILYLQDEH